MAVLVYLPTLLTKNPWILCSNRWHEHQHIIPRILFKLKVLFQQTIIITICVCLMVVYIIYYSFKYWCYWFYSYCKLLISTVSKHFRQHYNAVWWNVLKLYYAYCQASRWSTVTISGLECLTGRHNLDRIILLRLRIILIKKNWSCGAVLSFSTCNWHCTLA